jgi:hypothetical protein
MIVLGDMIVLVPVGVICLMMMMMMAREDKYCDGVMR